MEKTNAISKVLETSSEDARRCLHRLFISPAEIELHYRGYSYTDKQIQYFIDTLPSQEELAWLSKKNFMLLAGPPQPMSLLDIHDANNGMFFPKEKCWYANEEETFSREDKIECEWLAIGNSLALGSTNRGWQDQLDNVTGRGDYVPNVAQVAWALIAWKKIRDENLIPHLGTRTSSMRNQGHVYVVMFCDSYLFIGDQADNYLRDDFGILPARKLRR